MKKNVARKSLRYFPGIFRYSRKPNSGILFRYFRYLFRNFSVFRNIEYRHKYWYLSRYFLGKYSGQSRRPYVPFAGPGTEYGSALTFYVGHRNTQSMQHTASCTSIEYCTSCSTAIYTLARHFRPCYYFKGIHSKQDFFFFFFKSSGGWVKIKLKLPHFHASDTCVSI